jgi:hypothetical protein
VTRSTKCHQIRVFIGATLREWLDVVNFCCSSGLVLAQAFLTNRIGSDEPIANAFPGPAIPFLNSRVTVVLLIAFGFLLGMIFTKTIVG